MLIVNVVVIVSVDRVNADRLKSTKQLTVNVVTNVNVKFANVESLNKSNNKNKSDNNNLT